MMMGNKMEIRAISTFL